MPIEPFNAAQTLALATDLQGANAENAIRNLMLERERDPGSYVNRAREVNLQTEEFGVNVAREQLEQLQRQNAIPKLRTVLGAIGKVNDTIMERGVAAGRQRLAEQISSLKNMEAIPEDFEIEIDLDSLTDEEFVAALADEEQDMRTVLAGLLPDVESRTSAAIGDMRSLGYKMTPEGFRQYNEDRGTGAPEELEAMIAEARYRGLIAEQESAAEARAREAEERTRKRTETQQSIVRNLDQNRTAVDLTQRLEGTMLESGSVVPADWRRGLADLRQLATRAGGGDASELEETIADFDTQRKILQDQVNNRIASGDYGQSATQLQSLQQSLANPNISPTAIIRIQGQLAKMDLDRADANNIEIPNREEYEQLAKEWKSYSPISASSISRMSLEQVRGLDPDSLTDEEANAALKRLDELNE